MSRCVWIGIRVGVEARDIRVEEYENMSVCGYVWAGVEVRVGVGNDECGESREWVKMVD
jgi:hypothetical protein